MHKKQSGIGQQRSSFGLRHRFLILGMIAALFCVSTFVGCQQFRWWEKKESNDKGAYKSPNHDDEEQIGKIRNHESDTKKKEKSNSLFSSNTARDIDANLGGTRD